MIIQYDTRPNATVDEKLQSLIESVQLALNEKADKDSVAQIDKRLKKVEDE